MFRIVPGAEIEEHALVCGTQWDFTGMSAHAGINTVPPYRFQWCEIGLAIHDLPFCLGGATETGDYRGIIPVAPARV